MLKVTRKQSERPDIKTRFTGSVPWDSVFKDWLEVNLASDKPYTLIALAAKWKLNIGTLRNKASVERWSEKFSTALQERNMQGVKELENDGVKNEAEIRRRHALYSRLAMNKAILKLQAVVPENLSVKEAIELLKLGMEGERKALGIPDKYEIGSTPQTGRVISEVEAVQEAIRIINRLRPARLIEHDTDSDIEVQQDDAREE